MKKLQILLALALCVMLILPITYAEQMRVLAIKGPTAMGMACLPEEKYALEVHASGDTLVPMLVRGEADIAALPVNLAAVLYQRTEGEIAVLCINTLGMLSIVERGETVHSVEDLRGRTLYTAGKGAIPELVLNEVLRRNKLVPGEDVKIEYLREHSECLTTIMRDDTSLALLPQPFLTAAQLQAEDVRVALDLSTLWGESAPITGVCVVRRGFLEQNPEAVSMFMQDYHASIKKVLSSPAEAAIKIEEMDILPVKVATLAIPKSGIVMLDGDEMRSQLSSFLSLLFELAPESLGAALPGDAFYVA